ncbi:imidazoleglycerol-phosphate dehydratase HisB [Clostridium sp.]|uniref:imidazoleglycerol-phosphate dehydratase HisB n=1 Tax=Clostridium sp. TaxID=1506 RepID=UPI002FDCA362
MRTGEILRKTYETDIKVKMDLDGKGKYNIDTGIGFFNHMLCMIAKHGIMDMDLYAKGDLEVDFHHTVEDVGICIGKSIKKALGDKKGIRRYGTFFIPMDESLSMCSVDLSGRPFLVFQGDLKNSKVGEMDTELVEEFFRALAFNAEMTLHIKVFYGKNTHHIIESIFKSFAHALKEAVALDERIEGSLSTKGMI